MNSQMQQELLKRLDALSAKLGMAASAIWQMYLRQSYLDGIELMLGAALLSLGGLLFAKFTKKEFNRPLSHEERIGKDDHASGVLYGLVATGALTGAFFCLIYAVDFTFNPGLVAFQRIIESLRNL